MLVDGKFIYVCGLGECYLSIQLNGMMVLSLDFMCLVVLFDLFLLSIIESLNVQKFYLFNMFGYFGGGNVNICIKLILFEFVFNVSVGGGWNM